MKCDLLDATVSQRAPSPRKRMINVVQKSGERNSGHPIAGLNAIASPEQPKPEPSNKTTRPAFSGSSPRSPTSRTSIRLLQQSIAYHSALRSCSSRQQLGQQHDAVEERGGVVFSRAVSDDGRRQTAISKRAGRGKRVIRRCMELRPHHRAILLCAHSTRFEVHLHLRIIEMDPNGRIVETFSISSGHCLIHLRQSFALAQEHQPQDASTNKSTLSGIYSRYYDSSDDDGKDVRQQEDETSESSSSDEEAALPQESSSADKQEATTSDGLQQDEEAVEPARAKVDRSKRTKKSKPELDHKQREALVLKHLDSLHCYTLPLQEPSKSLALPTSLLPKELRNSRDISAVCRWYLDLATALQNKPIIVLFLRSGRFAAGVFVGDRCVVHTTSQRYTIRKGQGKAQSAQDSSRRPKSMGAQLRRAGEVKLNEDVAETLREWRAHVDRAALILVSCPKTMSKSLFGQGEVLSKDDDRIRRVPLDLGRPTFEHVQVIQSTMTRAAIREVEPQEAAPELESTVVDKATPNQSSAPETVSEDKEELVIPLTLLHAAARDGDLERLRALLTDEASKEIMDFLAGELLMSPLHYAAASTIDAAAACVLELLITGRANPGVVDVRNRPPYFVAASDKVREAFRRARAQLGEDIWDWDEAKVGPPLTSEDLQARKEKEAEKKRRKKARQKEKKAKEKAEAESMQQKLHEEEEERQNQLEAKRVRDGLQPKPAARNACDYCQKICKGKRSDMFKRLDYAYCSTDCVQKHKRELMASAALARLGGT